MKNKNEIFTNIYYVLQFHSIFFLWKEKHECNTHIKQTTGKEEEKKMSGAWIFNMIKLSSVHLKMYAV